MIPGEGKSVQSQLSSSSVACHEVYASIPGFSSHLGEEFALYTDVWSKLMPEKFDVNELLFSSLFFFFFFFSEGQKKSLPSFILTVEFKEKPAFSCLSWFQLSIYLHNDVIIALQICARTALFPLSLFQTQAKKVYFQVCYPRCSNK